MKKFFFTFFAFALFALEENELIWDPGPSVQEYHSSMQQAISAGDWWTVIDYANLISYNFPTSPFAPEASFIMGEAYYKLGQLEAANDCLSAYLNHVTSPKHFEEAIEYKYNIAESLANGVKKRLFSSPKMPAWVPAKEDSVPIFEEVIAAIPHSELAVKSLIGKAKIQAEQEDYKPSIETLDQLIRKFPKHGLAAEAFLEKEKVYMLQCQAKELDPDLLNLAEINIRKFRLAFPREPRIEEAEKIYRDMQEIFAQNLLETGKFFEKTKKKPSSLIYYRKVISKYPNTEASKICREKIKTLEPSSQP